MGKSKIIIKPSPAALNLIQAYVMQYGEKRTKSQALYLLETPKRIQKWFDGHYGYPTDDNLFVQKIARQFDPVAREICRALDGQPAANSFAIACTLRGLLESTFSELVSEILCNPVLVIAQRNDKVIDVVELKDDGKVWSFSKPLWNMLHFDRTWWIDNGRQSTIR